MILAVDIGNSNIVIGGYENNELVFNTRLNTDRKLEADQYAFEISGILNLYNVKPGCVDGTILSSVVPRVTDAVKSAMRRFCNNEPVILSQENSCIEVNIDNLQELGADILASAVAIKNGFALPAAVIDMGTATTIAAIDKNGTVQGVAIMPGLFISLDALTSRTSLLRGIEIEAPKTAIGKNTQQSMKSGVVFGTAAMLDGMLDRFEAELGSLNTIIATGGAAKLITPLCRRKIIFSDTLLLDGLYIVYKKATGKE